MRGGVVNHMTWQYAIALDIGGIHDYIFGTNKLREIRGASILLDKLNREFPIEELRNGNYGTEDVDWKAVITAGGNIKVLFKDRKKAEKFKNYLCELFNNNAPNAKVTVIVTARHGLNEEQQWLKKMEKELQREKLLHREKKQILTSGFFKACEACGLYPAEEYDTSRNRYICKSCYHKVKESKNYIKIEIYDEIKKKINSNNLELPEDFSQIGEASDPRGYMGFIYADGNKMGERLSGIKTIDELKRFSSDVHKATLDATVSAINKHFPSKDLPIQIILAGGDDLILALPAHKTIDVVIDFCEAFNSNSSSFDITTSAGVVICHDSLPIKNILNAAEALLKNAKAESRKNGGGKTYIDFSVVTSSVLENPVSKRMREMVIEDMGIHYITKRPYSVEGLKDLRDTIKAFKERGFPKNKLNMLYTSLFKGHYQSILDACYIKTRLSEEHTDLINNLISSLNISRFPWEELKANEYTTPFGDIVELYEFIS